MTDLVELLSLPAVQRCAVGLLIGSVSLPVVGVFIVGLDIIAVRFAVMHVALLGIAVGLITGLDPVLCGLVACALAGAGVAPLSRGPAGPSGAMGLLMTFAIAGALLLLSVSGVNATGAFELLWGSILATRVVDLVVLAVLAVVVHWLFWRRRRELGLVLFDRELALCSGVNADRLVLVLLVVIAVAIGGAIRLTGALLVDALTLLPALGARNLGHSLRSMVLWAIVLGLIGNTVGFFVALVLDQPLGPVLVLVAGTFTLLTYLVPKEPSMHAPRRALAATLLTLLTLALTACGSTDQTATGQTTAVADPPDGPVVVASTTWAGAFAKAAGAENVTVVAPATVPHPPDYDPKPSDLAAVASADYVLYAPFDSFAPRLRDAAGGNATMVELKLENTPAAIHSEVTRLGELFGTRARATQWLTTFDQRYAELSAQAKATAPQPIPMAVSHLFMGYWAEFAGLSVAGTFGPEPVTPGKLAELTALKPGVVLANSHLPNNPDIPGATTVELINFPGADLDLLGVFEENTKRLTAALSS